MFDFVQGDEPTMNRKPDPMMVETLCARFKVNKKEALYIGDTNVDMQTGVNSGVDFLLVTYGYRTKEELSIQCPSRTTIDSIKDIDKYL